MHLHVLGICGTFMAGLASLARDLGHTVSGADANAYPPMSDLLAAAGIDIIRGYHPGGIPAHTDVVVIGNALSRGNESVEHVLDAGLPYTSGPEWLARNLLGERRVLAVAGTHGKTTTSSMLARVLERAGLQPGFLVGGVPLDFGTSARAGHDGGWFVMEADEYDTAFFDKRSKFVHYGPEGLAITGLEYDHADIFPDLAAIERQFHHLLRTVPGSGRIVRAATDESIDRVIEAGCWTPVCAFSSAPAEGVRWALSLRSPDASAFTVLRDGEAAGTVEWDLIGEHNARNALAAIALADECGAVDASAACAHISGFGGVRRRLEVRGRVHGVTVYDDFAHHPTAVRATIAALRAHVGKGERILAALDPASNSMRLGIHRDTLAGALAGADAAWVRAHSDARWDMAALERTDHVHLAQDEAGIIAAVVAEAREGDHVLLMSNGAFGGIHGRMLEALDARRGAHG